MTPLEKYASKKRLVMALKRRTSTLGRRQASFRRREPKEHYSTRKIRSGLEHYFTPVRLRRREWWKPPIYTRDPNVVKPAIRRAPQERGGLSDIGVFDLGNFGLGLRHPLSRLKGRVRKVNIK